MNEEKILIYTPGSPDAHRSVSGYYRAPFMGVTDDKQLAFPYSKGEYDKIVESCKWLQAVSVPDDNLYILKDKVKELEEKVASQTKEIEGLDEKIKAQADCIDWQDECFDELEENYSELESDYAGLKGRYQTLQCNHADLLGAFQGYERKYGIMNDSDGAVEKAPDSVIKPGDKWEFSHGELKSIEVDSIGAVYVSAKIQAKVESGVVAWDIMSSFMRFEKAAFMDLTATGVKVA